MGTTRPIEGVTDRPERVRFEPPPSPPSAAVWEATREGVLLVPWCLDCGRPHWYPRWACPHCAGRRLEPRPAAGTGTVHALSDQHRPGWPGLAERVPYAVVVVDLDEGVRVLGELRATGDQSLVGSRVVLAWEPLSDGRRLPVFDPA